MQECVIRSSICPRFYEPVCGYYNFDKCMFGDCHKTFSNGCLACSDPDIEYWVYDRCGGED